MGFGPDTPDTVKIAPETEDSYTYSVVNASDNSCYSYTSPQIFTASITADGNSFFKPGATVAYQISSNQGDQSPVYKFVVPPAAGTPTRLALIGDLGQTVNSTETIAHIVSGTGEGTPYDAAIIVGDLSCVLPIHPESLRCRCGGGALDGT